MSSVSPQSNSNLKTLAGVAPIPAREVLPWAVLGGLLFLLAMYFVGVEEGATAIFNSMSVPAFVHDGRHLLGFPCH